MSTTRHTAFVTILVVILSALLITLFLNVPFLPRAAAVEAAPIDTLFVLMFCIASVFFSIALVVPVYSAIAFRSKPGDTEDGPHLRGNNWLEAIWSLVPLVIVMSLAIYGASVLNNITRAQPDALEIRVVSAQWSWQFEYPEQGITTSELRLPVNRQALLRLTSIDVVHSFWVPEFRVKQDAVPGMETPLYITPTATGSYTLLCAELCGLLHAYMTAPVAVVTQAEFDQWAQEQPR